MSTYAPHELSVPARGPALLQSRKRTAPETAAPVALQLASAPCPATPEAPCGVPPKRVASGEFACYISCSVSLNYLSQTAVGRSKQMNPNLNWDRICNLLEQLAVSDMVSRNSIVMTSHGPMQAVKFVVAECSPQNIGIHHVAQNTSTSAFELISM